MEASIWFSFGPEHWPNKEKPNIDISISVKNTGDKDSAKWYYENETEIKETIGKRLDFIVSGE